MSLAKAKCLLQTILKRRVFQPKTNQVFPKTMSCLIYPPELEIKDTTETRRSASYLDLLLEINPDGILKSRTYDKRDDFSFPIVNFPFLSSNIPSSPAYGVYMSQIIRYARACSDYADFKNRGILLTKKLLQQGFAEKRLTHFEVLWSPSRVGRPL